MSEKTFKHVSNLWNDAEASKLDPVARLIYRSNKLGSDQRITNTGGGNTSAKLQETDPLTGEKVEVLWVKGSGGDLRTSLKENFSSLYQDKLISLQKVYGSAKDKGPKSPAEALPSARSPIALTPISLLQQRLGHAQALVYNHVSFEAGL